MKKRVISLSLALLMTFSLLPSSALAADQDPPERGTLTCEEVIAPQYENAQAFSENLAAVKKDGKWGFVNEQNEVVIPFQYAYAWPFSESKAVVYKEIESLEDAPNVTADAYSDVYSEYSVLELGFIDLENHYTPLLFTDDEGAYTVTSTVTYYTMVRTMYVYDYANLKYTDQPRSTETYADENIRPENLEPLYFYNGALKIGDFICDGNGKEILFHVPESFTHPQIEGTIDTDYVYVTGNLTEGLIPIRFKGLDYHLGGYMDATGELVKLFDYEYFGEPVTRYDEDGTPREDRSFTHIYIVTPFNQGLAVAVQGTYNAEDGSTTAQYYGFIDRDFNRVIPPDYYWIVMTTQSSTYYEIFGNTGLAMVHNDKDLWGAIDKKGNTVLPFIYESLWPVSEGMILFQIDGAYGYLDAETLEVAIPAQYEQASHFYSGLAAVYDGEKAFLIDRSGQRIPDEGILDPSIYCTEYDDGTVEVNTPNNYVVTEQDGKFGISYVAYLPALPEKSQMSDWAYPEVTAAIKETLVPVRLQNLYRRNITRDDFCLLVVTAVSEILGMSPEELVLEKTGKPASDFYGANAFPDAISNASIIANALGIVGGRDDGRFDPYAAITRQEAAAMLARAARVLNMDTSDPQAAPFADRDALPSWATEAVDYVFQTGVMGGVGENRFDPTGTYTREQAYMTIYRLFNAYQAEAGQKQ